MSKPVMIEADGLRKQFGSFLAVRDVTFSISRGEVVAFLGPNGAGKTTTMRLLTGFVAPTYGTARIAGIDVQSDRIEAAQHLGYLPENGPLYPDMTPIGLLRFFGEARGIPGASCRNGSTVWLASARSRRSLTSRLASFRRVTASVFRWHRPSCTTRKS